MTKMSMFAIALELPRLNQSELTELSEMVKMAQEAFWEESVRLDFKLHVEIDSKLSIESLPFEISCGSLFVEFPKESLILKIEDHLRRHQVQTMIETDEEHEYDSLSHTARRLEGGYEEVEIPSEELSRPRIRPVRGVVQVRKLELDRRYEGWIPHLDPARDGTIYFHLAEDEDKLKSLAEEMAQAEKKPVDPRDIEEGGYYLVNHPDHGWHRALLQQTGNFYFVDYGKFVPQSEIEGSSVCALNVTHFEQPALCFHFRRPFEKQIEF